MLLRRATYGPTAAMRGSSGRPADRVAEPALAPASIADARRRDIASCFRARLTSTQVNSSSR